MTTSNTAFNTIAIIGSSGAIGHAMLEKLSQRYPVSSIHAFSRQEQVDQPSASNIQHHAIGEYNDTTLAAAAAMAAQHSSLDLVFVATGVLHTDTIQPEKSLRDLSVEKFEHLFMANTIVPALVAKHFVPKLHRQHRTIFAALSARVGSISDNNLGGWYAYRASKAALNMIIKNTAIETARKNRHAIVVGLHPGTVDSALSQPFQKNVPQEKLFSPMFSAEKLMAVIDTLNAEHSGRCFAWDGNEITP